MILRSAAFLPCQKGKVGAKATFSSTAWLGGTLHRIHQTCQPPLGKLYLRLTPLFEADAGAVRRSGTTHYAHILKIEGCRAADAQLRPWKMDAGDTALLDLLPLLEQVFRTNVPDVRAVVRSFEGQDIPSAFRERMLALQRAQQQERRGGLFSSLRR